jgi:hypothetical protein
MPGWPLRPIRKSAAGKKLRAAPHQGYCQREKHRPVGQDMGRWVEGFVPGADDDVQEILQGELSKRDQGGQRLMNNP